MAGSNITCRLFAAFERFKNPNLIRLAKYLPTYKGKIGLAVCCMLTAGLSSSLIATLLGRLTDAGFYQQQAWVVLAAPIGLILISLLHGGSMFGSNYLLGQVSQSILAELRRQIFHRMLHWPAETYQTNSTGLVTSKFVFEGNFALSNAAKSAITLVRDSIQVAALTVVLFWHNWELAMIALVIGPFVAWLLRYISAKMKKVMSSSQANIAELLVRVKEAYGAERLVKISNAYEQETSRFARLNADIKDLMIRMTKASSLGTPLTQLLCMTGIAVVLTIAMYQTQAGLLTIGEFVTFLAALLLIMPPLRHLAGLNASFVMMTVAAESLFATLDLQEEPDQGTEQLSKDIKNVVFDSVGLRYPGAERDAVESVSFALEKGRAIALVGLSGSGKTTIVNMLPRFWNPTSGRILINGVDAQRYTLSSLRSQIAIVSQDVLMFDDTIRANITYGCPNASDDDIGRAVADAALTDFVESLPQGLDTPVGEAGDRLSGGQKQRISIARAFLKNAPILILDEPTSALDGVSEAQIKDALTRLMAGRITLIVAHRLTTIEHADQILALTDGRIVESGSWQELIERNGLFAKLCRLQGISAKGEQEDAA